LSAWHLVVIGVLVGGLWGVIFAGALGVIVPVWVSVGCAFVLVAVNAYHAGKYGWGRKPSSFS